MWCAVNLYIKYLVEYYINRNTEITGSGTKWLVCETLHFIHTIHISKIIPQTNFHSTYTTILGTVIIK